MVIKGSRKVTTLADENGCVCNATVEGSAVKYVGGAGGGGRWADLVGRPLANPSATTDRRM